MRGKELLTEDQRTEFVRIPADMSESELETYYTFSQYDLEIIKRHRRDHNRLGFAVQLCVLRYLGWSLSDVGPIPDYIIEYIARQINVNPNSFSLYAQREPTKHEHMEEIRQVYGYQNFSLGNYRKVAQFLLNHALQNGNSMYLLRTAQEELRNQKIILPGMTTIERLVWETRQRAEERIFKSLTCTLSKWQKQKLDKLIDPFVDNRKTPLAWFRELPGQSSPEAFLKVIKRWIKLTDLLMEVAHWTGFDEMLIHASTNRPPKGEEKVVLMAALMAMGTNIGLTKMAEATPGVTYHQMANAAQWRLFDDAISRAQATLVNFQHKLKLASYWGDGSTSSSDGMRVQVGVSSLHADANPHYGSGKGATIYRFTSDQFSSFYTKVINTNARDAVHVIDGLLLHETDLNIEEHFTDTAGYADSVFGLSHLLGFRFAPRLRDLADSKLFTIQMPNEFPKLENILRGRINTKIIQENFDDVLGSVAKFPLRSIIG